MNATTHTTIHATAHTPARPPYAIGLYLAVVQFCLDRKSTRLNSSHQ